MDTGKINTFEIFKVNAEFEVAAPIFYASEPDEDGDTRSSLLPIRGADGVPEELRAFPVHIAITARAAPTPVKIEDNGDVVLVFPQVVRHSEKTFEQYAQICADSEIAEKLALDFWSGIENYVRQQTRIWTPENRNPSENPS